MKHRYRLHGLLIDSGLELDAATVQADPREQADLQMEAVPERPAEIAGRLACRLDVPAGSYVGTVGDGGWSLTLADEYAFHMPAGEPRILAWAPPRNRSSLPALLAGNVLAFWLQLRGHAVFHASAVTVADMTVAIAGPQGAGKTTVAAHLCAAGGELLTDDVLRVDPDGDGFVCHRGGSVLRLRADVEGLAEVVPNDLVERSWDGRLGVAAPAAEAARRLDAIVLPRHAPEGDGLSVERLPAKEATIELLGLPRWFGWQLEEPQRLHFRIAAEVASAVPVHRLGLTLDATRGESGLAERLLEALA